MYESNGITLSSAEYAELETLAESNDPVALAKSRLTPTGEKYSFDSDAAQIYLSLHEKGLIRGVKVWNGYILREVSVAGRAFISDYQSSQKAAEDEKKSDRRHDYRVEAFGAVLSFALGAVTEHFTGILGTTLETAESIVRFLSQIL